MLSELIVGILGDGQVDDAALVGVQRPHFLRRAACPAPSPSMKRAICRSSASLPLR